MILKCQYFMYIPKNYLTTDKSEIVAFMREYSFATLVTAKEELPIGTHLPFLVETRGEDVVLVSHFARANRQWEDLEQSQVLVIFSEPHAYISPRHYLQKLNVPTWNYFSVHAYGKGKLITDTQEVFTVLENTINTYEVEYRTQWDLLPTDYKHKMIKGIVAFEITIIDLQAKKKLSQNKTVKEQEQIIEALKDSELSTERAVAAYMRQNLKSSS